MLEEGSYSMSMMHIEEFNELCKEKQFSTVYEGVMWVAVEARKKANQTGNLLLHSEAIDWVLTGKEPEVIKILQDKKKQRKSFTRAYLEEILSYVDDKEVCRSVKDSIYESKKCNHLIYIYKDVQDDSRRARIRVLTRMIWYHLV